MNVKVSAIITNIIQVWRAGDVSPPVLTCALRETHVSPSLILYTVILCECQQYGRNQCIVKYMDLRFSNR